MISSPAPQTRRRGRVCIRPFEAEDVASLTGAVQASLVDLRPWLPWAHDDYDEEDARDWVHSRQQAWTEGEEYSFAVVHADTGRFLGGVGINRIDAPNRTGSLGYWVRTDATGQGVATTAARLAAGFGFDALRLRRLEILVAVENEASRRVAEKVGAVQEGRLRRRLRVRGTEHDAVLYALLSDRERDTASGDPA